MPLTTRPSEIPNRTVTVAAICRPRATATLDTVLQQLYAICGGGFVELRDDRQPGKVLVAQLESVQESPLDPQYLPGDPVSRLTLRFLATDPMRYDKQFSQVGLGTGRAICPLGTVPSAPLLRIYGQPTSPFTITLRDVGGVSRQVMGITLTLGANDYLEIDCDAQTITKVVSGTPSNAMDTWTTNADGFLILDPHDGSYAEGGWPTLELSTGQGLALYRKAYR
jgi:hypothetical protein